MQALTLESITPAIGSEVVGFDLASATPEQMQQVRAALNERMVLVFRDQHLNQQQHKALGAHFGTGVLHSHALAAKAGSGDPHVLAVKADANSKYVAGEAWHTDVTCDAAPIAVSMLYMKQTPANGGGDTLFTNMCEALNGLSPAVRAMLQGLTARHNGARPWREAYGIEPPKDQPYNVTVHPVILHHPETGRELLWVNGGFTERILELSMHESDCVLRMLFSQIEREPKYQCRVKWQPNTLVMWDNIGSQHMASWDYYPLSRYAERVSVIGQDLTKLAALRKAA